MSFLPSQRYRRAHIKISAVVAGTTSEWGGWDTYQLLSGFGKKRVLVPVHLPFDRGEGTDACERCYLVNSYFKNLD